MSRRLYLIRHTAVAVPAGICYGRSDVGLRENVDRHAKWLGSLLPADLPVFSSPTSRCLLLATALEKGAPVIDVRLAEMDFGDWEMHRFDDLPRQQIDAWASDPLGFRPPNGETGSEVMARVQAALADITAAHGSAIVVSHGGPLRGIHGALLGLPREQWLGCSIEPGSLTVLREEGGKWSATYMQCPER